MNPIEESIYQYINNIIEISEEQEPLLIQYCRMFSAVITGSFYVLDISKKRFIYIKPDDLLLCGYSVKEAMKLNFDLFPLIIHPEKQQLSKACDINSSRTNSTSNLYRYKNNHKQ